MYRDKLLILKLMLVMVGLLALGSHAVEQGKIDQVLAGRIKEARASWWGFNQEDATEALQAAINSRVPRLVVDKRDAPWITRPLFCVSDQEIVFEQGVEVLAKKGEFMDKKDALFSLVGVTNVTLRGPGATLRMRRADYDAPPYAHAEWRHVLNMLSAKNIRVLGLTLAESGGDGIYLGCRKAGGPCADITIRDVLCDRNYRQGISVISAENLLIENTVMRDTGGTNPRAGIDFEPNRPGEVLKNCVMRNCITENNEGCGFLVAVQQMNAETEPISLVFENCRSTGDRNCVAIHANKEAAKSVRGSILFRKCVFEKARYNPVVIRRKPATGAEVVFSDCLIADGGTAKNGKDATDIMLPGMGEDEASIGNIKFDNLTIRQPEPRPWLLWHNYFNDTDNAISGTVIVQQGGKSETHQVSREWLRKNFPARFTVRVPIVPGDLSKARVINNASGLRKLSPMRLRHQGSYLFYAEKGCEALLIGTQIAVGRKAMPSVKRVIISNLAGKVLKRLPLPGFNESAEVRFTPKESGFYRMSFDVGVNSFRLNEANVPVGVDSTHGNVALIASVGPLYAAIPRGSALFAFCVAGQGAECVKATVYDPAGQAVWTRESISYGERYTAGKDEGRDGGLWRINFAKPPQGTFEDFLVRLRGVPGYLFLDDQRYWEF